MINLSRRKLIVSGLAATAGASGLVVGARLAQKYGLIPPDHDPEKLALGLDPRVGSGFWIRS